MKKKSCKKCQDTNLDNFRQRLSKKIGGKIRYEPYCRQCERDLVKIYYQNNKDARIAYSKKYTENNREIIRSKKKIYDQNRYPQIADQRLTYMKNYASQNRDKINQRKYNREKNDPAYRLRNYLSGRINHLLKIGGYKKKGSCIKHLSFTFDQLVKHIENQFESWMTWDNHGVYHIEKWDDNDQSTWTWQLDHIVPCSMLPFSSMEDDNFKKCWSLENLRPLSSKQNILDGTRRVRHE